jgi:hypothetical protein
MKTLLCALVVSLPCVAQPPVIFVIPNTQPAPARVSTGYEVNPAAQKQAERQAHQKAQRDAAYRRAQEQLVIEYLARIAGRR